MKKSKMWTVAVAAAFCAALMLGGCGNGGDAGNQESSSKDSVASVEESAQGSGEQSAADESSEAPGSSTEVQMWDGYYYDDSTGRDCFVRLNEDGTYYAKYFGGSVTDAGTWQLLDEELEYSIDAGADGDMNTVEDNGKATASQVVELASYTGDPVKVAYVDDALTDMSFAGMANHRTAAHVPDYPYNPETDETPIQIYVFYANNDMGSSLILQHDKNFTDVTGEAFLSGTWEMESQGVYQLTYEDGGSATLTVTDGGKNAALVQADGSELALRDDYKEETETGEALLVMALRADSVTVEGQPMAVNVRLDAYEDNTCQVFVEIAQIGAEIPVDQGTWEMSPAMKPTFHLETAGDVEGVPDYATATEAGLNLTLPYAAQIQTEFGGNAVEMGIDTELAGSYAPGGISEEEALAEQGSAE